MYVTEVLGRAEDERFRGRRVVALPVAWDEASRRRLRRAAADGTDVAIDLPGSPYLADGTVLDDDGERILVVKRPPEPALLVRFHPGLSRERVIAQAISLGHAFGNQHVPLEVAGGEAHIPLTTSEAVARATVEELGLEGATVDVAEVALGSAVPLSGGGAHSHSHA